MKLSSVDAGAGARLAFAALLCVVVGCAGGSSSSSSNNNGPPPPPPATVPVASPTVVSLSPGQQVNGIGISVPAPAVSPAINAQDLGVTSGLSGSAFNTGDQIHEGDTKTILMFGPGLSANLQISISGPNDITVSNPQTIKATDGTPGVAFEVKVAPNAALGDRTVILQNPKQDISTFTGGLEVIP